MKSVFILLFLSFAFIQVNAQGWDKTFGGSDLDNGYSVQQTIDGGYIIAGYTQGLFSNHDFYLIKTDSNGNSIWTKTFGGIKEDYGSFARQTTDGGYIIVGKTEIGLGNMDVYLIKTDSNGNSLWTKTFGGINDDRGQSIQQTIDGGYIIAGITSSFGAGAVDVYLFKTDANGDSLWTKTFGGTNDEGKYFVNSVQQTTEGGYIIAGSTSSFGAGGSDVYLIKTDSLGNTVSNTISGNIFIDTNSNCVKDIGEFGLNKWIAKILPTKQYVSSDANGFYSTVVDTGTYTISLAAGKPYYQLICPSSPNTYTVNFSQFYDTSSNNNFGNQIPIYGPLMWVDIATNIVRPCRQGEYTLNYCNNGTTDASNAYIKVSFPDKIIPLSSSPISWSSVNGNIYRFDLGTITTGQCGTIYISTSVACDALIGSTLCVKAIIFPDSVCTPIDTIWDESSLEVTGICSRDFIKHFVIYNFGQNMSSNAFG